MKGRKSVLRKRNAGDGTKTHSSKARKFKKYFYFFYKTSCNAGGFVLSYTTAAKGLCNSQSCASRDMR